MTNLTWQEVTELFKTLSKALSASGHEPNLEIKLQDSNPDRFYIRLWVREKENDDQTRNSDGISGK